MAEQRRPVLWSAESLTDLDGIWDNYAGVASPSTANTIVRDIGRVVALIEDQPFAGRSRDEVRPGLRSIAASPHVIFDRIRSGRPEIVRVLDGRRDIDEIFSEHSK